MSNLSFFANMTREELEKELTFLKNTNMLQFKQIEEEQQQIYDLKRNLSISKSMEEHYASELECIQNTNEAKIKELLKKIEQINLLHQKDIDTVQFYETEILKKNAEIVNMIEIDNKKHAQEDLSGINKNEKEKYADEIYELKSKLNDLTDELNEFELKYKEAILNNTTLENKNSELTKDLMELKEHLHIKEMQLNENKDMISNLQDEMAVMQKEVTDLKSLPVNKATKGNSLFAEVDDNRVKLQKYIEVLKKQFNEIQLKYSNKSQELQKLHFEYAALIKEIDNQNNSNYDQLELIKSYKKHYDDLNITIENLVRDLKEQKVAYEKLISRDMKFAVEMISANRSELFKLQQKLNAESLALAFNEQSHFETKRELKHCQVEIIRLRGKIMQNPVSNLEETESETKPNNSDKWLTSSKASLTHIDDSFLFSDSDKSLNDIEQNSIIPNVNGNENLKYEMQTENKENILVDDNIKKEEDCKEMNNLCDEIQEESTKKKKTVSFSSNTLEAEPKVTNRIGRKVINALPIHIASIKK